MDYIMETVGLRKSYKGNVVVNDVNIHVPKGAIYGFVGPNGAGKSTVMKMILNLIQPEAGEVQLFGEKVTDQSYEVFKRVGSIIENPYFYEKMTARQNLELHCDYMGFPNKERIDEVLQMVDLQNVEGKQIRHYSLGMKQRLAIARAILAKPEFLILRLPQKSGRSSTRQLLVRNWLRTSIQIRQTVSFTVRNAAARGRPLCHALGNPATLCRAASASASRRLRSSARLLKNGSAAWSVSNAERHRACKTAISMTTPLPTTTAKTH